VTWFPAPADAFSRSFASWIVRKRIFVCALILRIRSEASIPSQDGHGYIEHNNIWIKERHGFQGILAVRYGAD